MSKFSILLSAVAIAFPAAVEGHGYSVYPPARQVTCFNDGGIWSGTPPNAACANMKDKNQAYPFVQKNEFAAMVPDFHNFNAVKNAIPDGTLCSAGDPRKSAASTPGNWQHTPIKSGSTFQMKWLATAPHNPSFWEFFITRPGFDSTKSAMTWDDLELFQEVGDTPTQVVDGQKHYLQDITLPAGRTGKATLYVRWQRDDSAGEGFYNCIDLDLSSSGPTPPPSVSTDRPSVPKTTTVRPTARPTTRPGVTTRPAGTTTPRPDGPIPDVDVDVQIEAPEGVPVKARLYVRVGDKSYVREATN